MPKNLFGEGKEGTIFFPQAVELVISRDFRVTYFEVWGSWMDEVGVWGFIFFLLLEDFYIR